MFIQNQLNTTWWDSNDIPRFDVIGNAINPSATGTSPPDWPVVTVKMPDSGFMREWTFEDPYTDEGEILVQVWGLSRDQTEPLMDQIVGLFASVSNWNAINQPPNNFLPATADSSPSNPYYVISMLLQSWTSVMEEEVRLAGGQLCYRCDMHYQCRIHGAVSTA